MMKSTLPGTVSLALVAALSFAGSDGLSAAPAEAGQRTVITAQAAERQTVAAKSFYDFIVSYMNMRDLRGKLLKIEDGARYNQLAQELLKERNNRYKAMQQMLDHTKKGDALFNLLERSPTVLNRIAAMWYAGNKKTDRNDPSSMLYDILAINRLSLAGEEAAQAKILIELAYNEDALAILPRDPAFVNRLQTIAEEEKKKPAFSDFSPDKLVAFFTQVLQSALDGNNLPDHIVKDIEEEGLDSYAQKVVQRDFALFSEAPEALKNKLGIEDVSTQGRQKPYPAAP